LHSGFWPNPNSRHNSSAISISFIPSKRYQYLDISTPKEFKNGHIENATNINFYDKEFADQVQVIDKPKTLVIYCHSGYRTYRASKIFEQTGFDAVYDLTEDYAGWQKLNTLINNE